MSDPGIRGELQGEQWTPSPIAPPTPKSQEMVLVRRSEIAALKRDVTRALRDPMGYASPWAFSWLGVGVGASISLVAILAVADQKVRPWAIAVHVVLIVVGFFLAAFCGWIARQQHNTKVQCEKELHAELETLNKRAPSTLPEVQP